MRASDRLMALSRLFAAKNRVYGNKYLGATGRFLAGLFSNGLLVEGEEDWGRLYLLMHILTKIDRYATNFKRGGHSDSLDDIAVYAMMLREYDENADGADSIGGDGGHAVASRHPAADDDPAGEERR